MKKNVALKITNRRSQSGERGAALILVFLSIVMFLYIAILFLDIPYLERVGRSIQRAVDAAALAGATQLTARSFNLADGNPDTIRRQQGWIRAKRAVFASLAQNPIKNVENLDFISAEGSGTPDLLDSGVYAYPNFSISVGTQSAIVSISRGVYQRPFTGATFTPGIVFYPVEIGDPNRNANNCIQTTVDGLLRPTACLGSHPVINVADSVKVTLTVNGIPTLFAKLLGFNSFTSITRTAIAGRE